MLLRGRLAFVLLTLSCTLPGTAAAQDSDRIKADEEALRAAGVALEGPALLDFFRARTPGEKALEGIESLLKELGSEKFRFRQRATDELMRIGPQALGPIRALLTSRDPEIARRARDLVAALEKSVQPTLMSAAVRILADRKPAGAAKVLLDHLPAAADDYFIEEIHRALVSVGFVGGKPDEALKAALEDRHARRRAAAAEAIIRGGKDEDRLALRKLLKDPDIRVRSCVAIALVERKDRDSVVAIIEALAEAPQDQFWRIEQILYTLAGDDAPKSGPGSTEAEKRDYRTAWQTWWREKGPKVDMAALDSTKRLLGLTLIVQYDIRVVGGAGGAGRIGMGRVYEVGPDGKPRWEIKDLNYPLDAQVVGRDRVLVAEYRARAVTERNFKGETIWTKALNTYPVGVQRLDNGNTLIAERTGVMEVNKEGTEVSRWQTPGNIVVGARKARNGEIVVVDSSGTIHRLDNKGRVVKTVRTGAALTTVIGTQIDVLPNGNVLVPVYSQNKVIEYDGDGKKVWEATSERPTACSRLPNGNTLVASRYTRGAVEIDRTGKQVWQFTSTTGNVLQARRR